MKTQRLVLASRSPRRRELLQLLVEDFEVAASHVDENETEPNRPGRVALDLAGRKAREVAAGMDCGTVIGADTVIDFRGQLLGKPQDSDDALTMLVRLCGHRHEVITGLAAIDVSSGREAVSLVRSSVVFRGYSRRRVEEYVASGEPLDKAGSYAIQGLGKGLVSSFAGCYNNIVGLPLCEVERLLRRLGWPGELKPTSCRLPDHSLCPRSEEEPPAPVDRCQDGERLQGKLYQD